MKARASSLSVSRAAGRIGDPAARILIVDDEPHVCEIMSRWLDGEGYNCHTANSAEEAWGVIKRNDLALVILDIAMPGQSGIDLLAMVKAEAPEMAVIMVTAMDDRETAIRALELGAYGYVIKPFGRNEVIINVVNALERRRLMLESKGYERRLEEKVREQTQDIRRSREEIALRLMAAQEYRHDETGAHVRRMGLYAEVVGRVLGHPQEYTDILRLAAPMHDVGKIGIPDSVLMKPGKLTAEEFETMKTHTSIGARILGPTTIPLLNVARDIALCHHERWDGLGYPRGLSGEDIPEPARIVAPLDVYDALVHDRVYRPAVPEQEALDVLRRGCGTHLDPAVLEALLAALTELRAIRGRVKEKAHFRARRDA